MIHRGIFDLFPSLETCSSSIRANTATVRKTPPIESIFICAMMLMPSQMHRGIKRITHIMGHLYHMMVLGETPELFS
ncbi:MAG TPA: hypothetical protein PLA83_10830 [Deltaproteobacteria bacterium]|nr:hypothetical protein [Deltaproteobacteria bacterium]HQI00463.1 hypothetical protein [Deltaproteobacteria bacterium]